MLVIGGGGWWESPGGVKNYSGSKNKYIYNTKKWLISFTVGRDKRLILF